jgi:hypothetical protein
MSESGSGDPDIGTGGDEHDGAASGEEGRVEEEGEEGFTPRDYSNMWSVDVGY